jgi:hypothetical protein
MGTEDFYCHKDSGPCELHDARFFVWKKTGQQLVKF